MEIDSLPIHPHSESCPLATPQPQHPITMDAEAIGLSLHDAIGHLEKQNYLHAVRKEFETQPKVYSEFLNIMVDFEQARVGPFQLIQRVLQLFTRELHLLEGLNQFLPVGFHVTVASDRLGKDFVTINTPVAVISDRASMLVYKLHQSFNTCANDSHGAIASAKFFGFMKDFVDKVKTTYGDKSDTHTSFLELMRAVKDRHVQAGGHEGADMSGGMLEMQDEIDMLFHDHPELALEFKGGWVARDAS